MFDRQVYFDRGVRGIREQGGPAMGEGRCVYRAKNGAKCFHGHNIPDDKYSKDLEGTPIGWAPKTPCVHRHQVALAAGINNQDDAAFAKACQSAHDNAWQDQQNMGLIHDGFMERFLANARKVAEKYGLDASVCD